MKKISFFILFPIVFLMSSCLGDTESAINTTSDYVYVTSSNGVKYAISYNYVMPLTSSEILSLQEGSVVNMSYKVNLDNGVNQDGIYKAENVVIEQSEIYTPASQSTVSVASAPVVGSDETDKAFITTPTALLSSGSLFGDRWIFSYSCSLAGAQYSAINVYYDENNQFDNDGTTALADGTIVVDLRLSKGTPESEVTATTQSKKAVLNLSTIRQILESKVVNAGLTQKTYNVRFRTYVYNSTTQTAVLNYPASYFVSMSINLE